MLHVLAHTFFTVWAVVYRPESVCGVLECLESRRPCLQGLACSSLMASIPQVCGPTDNEHCYSQQRGECRDTLLRLKASPEVQSNCFCPATPAAPVKASDRSCQDWYNLVYNHPCLYQQQLHPAFLPQYQMPGRGQFSFDLELANQLLLQRHIVLSCTAALHACRKSPLCRRVYDEFRRRCKLKDDRCRMTNAALCYNSYELIKLTPLWKCICDRPSEKRCMRIQKSIIANACILGSFPWLLKEEETTPITGPPPTRPPRPRPTLAPSTGRLVAQSTATTLDEWDIEHVDEPSTSTLSPEPETVPEPDPEPYPGPNEKFLLFPRIALLLIQPLMETVRNLLVLEYEIMQPLPPPPVPDPTTLPPPAETEETPEGEGDLEGPGDEVETTAATGGAETVVVMPSTLSPVSSKPATALPIAQRQTSSRATLPAKSTRPTRGPWRVTVPSGRPAANMTTRSTSRLTTLARSQSGSTPRTTTRTTGRLTPTTARTLTTAIALRPQPVNGDMDGTISTTSEETSTSASTEDETPVTETTVPPVEEPIVYTPDPRGHHSGTCLTQIEQWRLNAAFDEAIERFQNSCRWHSDLNETCDATACLDAEMRVRRWMGGFMTFCRNLSCEGNPYCEQLLQMLSPGCINVAPYLEEMDTEMVIKCRDVRRNLRLEVPRNQYRRVFLSETCSQLCTCDIQAGAGSALTGTQQMRCYNLPCIESMDCNSSYASYPTGSPAYRAFQGACICYASRLHCIRPYNYTVGKGAWLFMGYSAMEEALVRPYTNVSLALNLIEHLQRVPYPHRSTDTCLFRQVPTETDYIVLKAEAFEWDNSSAETGIASAGTLANEVACDKFFRWLANQISERRAPVRQDLLLSLIKLAEAETNPHTAAISGARAGPGHALLQGIFLTASWQPPVALSHLLVVLLQPTLFCLSLYYCAARR